MIANHSSTGLLEVCRVDWFMGIVKGCRVSPGSLALSRNSPEIFCTCRPKAAPLVLGVDNAASAGVRVTVDWAVGSTEKADEKPRWREDKGRRSGRSMSIISMPPKNFR